MASSTKELQDFFSYIEVAGAYVLVRTCVRIRVG